MAKHFVWAASAAVMVCAVAYCSVQVDALQKRDRMAQAEFCVKNGGVWTYGWGLPWCNYVRESAP